MPLPAATTKLRNTAIEAGKDFAVVATGNGPVRGYTHNGIYTFKGIPYGVAKRFMAPQQPDHREGIRSCLAYGSTCPSNTYPQLNDVFSFAFQGQRGLPDENCLNLNVWTSGDDQKKPVMIWLHGGGFSDGSSMEFPSLDGENLSRSGDVVVVSLNHRLNVLGFLELSAYGEKYRDSANVGMRDILLALEWVKENIAGFGGDPSNVTLFGQSGGGTKVMCLMNVPSARGLFHKAIIQSGSSLTKIMNAGVARQVSAELLKILNLTPAQVDQLQDMDYGTLAGAGSQALRVVAKILRPDEMSVFGLEWEPVQDGRFLPFQPDEPQAIELSRDIPLIVGSTKNEFMPFADERDLTMDRVKCLLQEKYGSRTEAYIAAVKEAYPGTEKPSDYWELDSVFRPLVIRQASDRSNAGHAPVYMYLFQWQSPVLDGYFKAVHNMDLPFVFNNIRRCEEFTGGGIDAQQLAEKISRAWAAFAKTGNPNHNGLPPWPGYTTANGSLMRFDEICQVQSHHDKALLAIVSGV